MGKDSAPPKPAIPGSWNRYTYGLGNPMKFLDPDGQEPEPTTFDRLYAWLREKISGIHKPQFLDPNDPNVKAAREIGANPNILPQNQVALLQQGLNDSIAALGAAGIVDDLNIGEAKALEIVSRIGESSALVRAARGLSGDQQLAVDRIVARLGTGRLEQGIGTRTLFGKVFEARARNGARVAFRVVDGKIEILAKFNKNTQDAVISLLRQLYE